MVLVIHVLAWDRHKNVAVLNLLMVSHGVGNPRPGLGQTQQCGSVKLVNGISSHPPLIYVFNMLSIIDQTE